MIKRRAHSATAPAHALPSATGARPRRGKVAWILATWFGCGLVPIAPGTIGALGAIPLYLLVAQKGPAFAIGIALLVSIVGLWAADVVSRETGIVDAQVIVIDEVAGMLLTLVALKTPAWRAILLGMIVFRILDMAKPWPIRLLERLPGAWAIMLDDIAAGAVGAVILGALRATGVL